MKFSATIKRHNGDIDTVVRFGRSSSEVYATLSSLRTVKQVIAVIEISE